MKKESAAAGVLCQQGGIAQFSRSQHIFPIRVILRGSELRCAHLKGAISSQYGRFDNPGFACRLVHRVLAADIAAALVGGGGAWHWLKDCGNPYARRMYSMAMRMAPPVAPLQTVAGDMHGVNTPEH